MRVNGLNHVNIVASDLEKTVQFYESVLGMRAAEIPMAPAGFSGRWIYDEAEQPIIHVQAYNPERTACRKHGDRQRLCRYGMESGGLCALSAGAINHDA